MDQEQSTEEANDVEELRQMLRTVWVFLVAVMVFWMQAGFALLEFGSVRAFHAGSILVKNVVDGAITLVAFFVIGFPLLSSSGNAFAGSKYFVLNGVMDEPAIAADWLLAAAFAASSVTIVSGALAERCQLWAYFGCSALISAFIFPIASHWTYANNGWLSAFNRDAAVPGYGLLDQSGGCTVHALGGMAALIGVAALGPRRGRFSPEGQPVVLQGAVGNSGVYKVLGAILLFVSFLAFNAAPVGAHNPNLVGIAGANTCIAAACSSFTVMAIKVLLLKYQVHYMHSVDGTLAGCVAITACPILVHPWAAAVIGIVAGLVYHCTVLLMLKLKLDDVVNAVAIHLTPGIWGVVAVGIFGCPECIERAYDTLDSVAKSDAGLIYGGNGKLLGVQLLGIVVILVWVAAILLPFFLILRATGLLRMDESINVSMHGGHATISAWTAAHGKDAPRSVEAWVHKLPAYRNNLDTFHRRPAPNRSAPAQLPSLTEQDETRGTSSGSAAVDGSFVTPPASANARAEPPSDGSDIAGPMLHSVPGSLPVEEAVPGRHQFVPAASAAAAGSPPGSQASSTKPESGGDERTFGGVALGRIVKVTAASRQPTSGESVSASSIDTCTLNVPPGVGRAAPTW